MIDKQVLTAAEMEQMLIEFWHKYAGPPTLRVLVNAHLPRTRRDQIRFPRSKNRRIRRKWAKRSENYGEVDATGDLWYIGGSYYIRPEALASIRANGSNTWPKSWDAKVRVHLIDTFGREFVSRNLLPTLSGYTLDVATKT